MNPGYLVIHRFLKGIKCNKPQSNSVKKAVKSAFEGFCATFLCIRKSFSFGARHVRLAYSVSISTWIRVNKYTGEAGASRSLEFHAEGAFEV